MESNSAEAAVPNDVQTTSRALNLNLTKEQVEKHCDAQDVRISMIETLPDRGVRLVCASGSGAAKMRAKLGRNVIKGDVRRSRIRPVGPLW
jgi:hypothetical protein